MHKFSIPSAILCEIFI